jgi:hypothetical protein
MTKFEKREVVKSRQKGGQRLLPQFFGVHGLPPPLLAPRSLLVVSLGLPSVLLLSILSCSFSLLGTFFWSRDGVLCFFVGFGESEENGEKEEAGLAGEPLGTREALKRGENSAQPKTLLRKTPNPKKLRKLGKKPPKSSIRSKTWGFAFQPSAS